MGAVNPICLIELNEFNDALLHNAINKIHLPYLSRFLSFDKFKTLSPDSESIERLEPWSQWVSIHTGQRALDHQITHLGQSHLVHPPQIWDTLADHGLTCGLWGLMNAKPNLGTLPAFYLPDPWNRHQNPIPQALHSFFKLPQWLASHYLDYFQPQFLRAAIAFMGYCLTHRLALPLVHTLLNLLKSPTGGPYRLICLFERLSALGFMHHLQQYTPHMGFLFLNSLAHCQHHHWHQGPEYLSRPLRFCLTHIEATLKMLYHRFNHQYTFVLYNGFSQTNTCHLTPWLLYRLKNPAHFCQHVLGLKCTIEPLMTHDNHLQFSSPAQAESAKGLLKHITLEDRTPLFEVIPCPQSTTRLFFQLRISHALSKDSQFWIQNKGYRFFKYFKHIITRTGQHSPKGTIYSQSIGFDQSIWNHQFSKFIFQYFRLPIHAAG